MLRYVEPLRDARTPLEEFFSILLVSCHENPFMGSHSINSGQACRTMDGTASKYTPFDRLGANGC
jgi:hypothetical protein